MRRRALVLLCGSIGLVACRIRSGPDMTPRTLPDIPVYEIAPGADSGLVLVPAPANESVAALGATKLVSITANDADVRTLLLWLAEQAGVSIVVAPDVRARVSVSFNNVPAGQAIREILARAGLSVLAAGEQSPWPPVVFYQAPVDINKASAEAIVGRFGVSLEMARWIVESRKP